MQYRAVLHRIAFLASLCAAASFVAVCGNMGTVPYDEDLDGAAADDRGRHGEDTGGSHDAGRIDSGGLIPDAGHPADAGTDDASMDDAGDLDASLDDTGSPSDTGFDDTGTPTDTGTPPDTGFPIDTGHPADAGRPDGGLVLPDGGGYLCSLSWGSAACNTCFRANCAQQCLDCANNGECVSAIACVAQCATNDFLCWNGCLQQYPGGASAIMALYNCVSENCKTLCGL